MTKLSKSPIPPSLNKYSERWTMELQSEIQKNDGDVRKVKEKYWNKYRREDVRDTLKTESYGKCMYCDTKIGVSDYEQIEHIVPKKKYPHLTYEWSNLGWACEKCNNNKKMDELLNPYDVDLELRLKVKISMLLAPKDNDDYQTLLFIRTLKLNDREELIAKRCQVCSEFENELNKLKDLIDKEDPNVKYFYRGLLKEIECDKEYY
ncbi:TIGR02646 family protein, partial [Enterococcus faecium]|nr:TIGR02646 family protein [Enterococcus faecium]